MKKIKLVLFLSMITIFTAFGQIELPPAYQIISDTATDNISLPDSNWQMMADPSGEMTFQQILQLGNFQDTIRKTSYKTSVYWLRYRFKNNMQKEAEIALTIGKNAFAEAYIKIGNGAWKHERTGTEVPWSKRDGLKRAGALTTSIPAGQEMLVYERDHFDYVFQTPGGEGVDFSFTENVIQKGYRLDDGQIYNVATRFLMIGFLLLALVINIYFFFIVREKEFLYLTLFVLFYSIIMISGSGVFFIEYPRLLLYSNLLGQILISFFLIYFVRSYLKTRNYFPRWDKWLILLSFLSIFFVLQRYDVYLSPFIGKGLLSTLRDGFMIVMFSSLIITLLFYIRTRAMSIRLLIIAMAPFFLHFVLSTIVQFARGIGYNDALPVFVQFLLYSLGSIGLFWMVIVLTWILFLRFSMLRKKLAQQELEREKERSAFIEQQKAELEKQVTERTSELKQSLDNLKSTQKQLIQSEKMASLGELTAGIAYEIQNPLNFVNNFSEVNKELVDELQTELKSGNTNEAISISNDIKENEEKINHHGKRADAIVKGMLQHSRVSSGVKEPTDINALCDEYLRLSYHDLRAKDKSFNATMKTDFDESIGKIDIVAQDIGRVILNLINNAFYAVDEKKKQLTKDLPGFQNLEGLQAYEPTVSVSTKKSEHHVIITVIDNGNGIPQKIVDKIFQPFFTTKPTGQGTGLGLSLSYDIVKVVGGEIKVETNESEGTEFTIQLPLKENI